MSPGETVFVADQPSVTIHDGIVRVGYPPYAFAWQVSCFRQFVEDCRVALLAYDDEARNVIRLRGGKMPK